MGDFVQVVKYLFMLTQTFSYSWSLSDLYTKGHMLRQTLHLCMNQTCQTKERLFPCVLNMEHCLQHCHFFRNDVPKVFCFTITDTLFSENFKRLLFETTDHDHTFCSIQF